ncbi:MAG: hydrogenase 3 maturation endopeptidase HyCI [Coriobacteriales bacterium]|nr:hydrogenase 3 maturation endopeptidase HyCI [Coriobacteriales bacterium]
MLTIKELLTTAIADHQAVAVLGCGSPLRGDDAAGSQVAERLADLGSGSDRRFAAFFGDVAPENLTGEIKRFAPQLLLVIDIADMGLEPGQFQIIDMDKIGGVSFSTHKLPLPIILDYLQKETGCRIVILGIQAASLEFLAEMTPAVAQTVDEIVLALRELLG